VRRPADRRRGGASRPGRHPEHVEEEDRFLKKSEEVKTFYASEVRDNVADVTKGIVSSLSENVYISIDLDVFDPGIMPAVVTPEPGGSPGSRDRHPADVMRSNRNIVGFDVMELAPIAGWLPRTTWPPAFATD